MFEFPDGAKLTSSSLDVNGRQVAAKAKQTGREVTLTPATEMVAAAGQAIEARLQW